MASSAQIISLRLLINEEDVEGRYSDIVLNERIDSWTGDLRGLASNIWREKAAAYSELVDVKEGNSDRKLSQLYKQALAMAESLSVDVLDDDLPKVRRSRTRQIERM